MAVVQDLNKLKLQMSTDAKLGVTFCALPPGPLVVSKVLPGMWADVNGVVPGDVVLSVNGQSPQEISRDEFFAIMETRPTTIMLDRPSKTASMPAAEEPAATVPSATPEVQDRPSLEKSAVQKPVLAASAEASLAPGKIEKKEIAQNSAAVGVTSKRDELPAATVPSAAASAKASLLPGKIEKKEIAQDSAAVGDTSKRDELPGATVPSAAASAKASLAPAIVEKKETAQDSAASGATSKSRKKANKASSTKAVN